MGFQISQILYWLCVSTWFGAVLFVAVAAPIIFRTVREFNPILPSVLSVNLENQHGTLLAGSIVGNILRRLTIVELICSGGILLALITQAIVSDISGSNLLALILRAALYLSATAIVLIDWLYLSPRIVKARDEYLDHADEPEVANPAKDRFDDLHRQSVAMMTTLVFLLMGIILFSGTIVPRKTSISYGPSIEKTN